MFWLGALMVALLVLLSSPLFVTTPYQQLTILERMVPRIERAQVLAPESRELIVRLLDRVREDAIDPRYEARRLAAVARVSAALGTKDAASQLSSVGQGEAGR
jgi:hypothetical protein